MSVKPLNLCGSLKQLLLLFIVIILCLVTVPIKGLCFTVTAQVDRNKISINESLLLSITFEDGEAEIDTSSLNDFTIVSKSSSSNISIINGKYSKSITYTYTLLPQKTGNLKIPPFRVEIDNQIYTTREITVEVTENANAHTVGGSKDIFLESGISGTSLVTGQQAVYQLRFYSAVKLSNATLQPPSFKGFNAKEAGERKNYTETINGRVYSVSEINYLLIPETTGELEIDPAVIICEVPVRDRRNSHNRFDDPFFSEGIFSFGRTETRQFTTSPVSVKVENLPPYPSNFPNNIPFYALVGDFSIEADIDNISLKTGESATLTITISGKGNIMDAQAPSVQIPPEFKVYDDSPEESIELSLEGYSGKKVFKKAVVPIKSGRYTIEPIYLSFFNIQTQKYEIVSTAPIEIEASSSTEEQQTDNVVQQENQGVNNINSTAAQNSGQLELDDKKVVKKRRVEFTGKDILSIKEEPNILVSKNSLSFPMFMLLFFIPPALFFIFTIAIKISKRDASASEVMLKKAKESLKAASEILKKENIRAKDSDLKEAAEIDDNKAYFLKLLHDALIALIISKSKKNSGTGGSVKEINNTDINSSSVNSTTITAITTDEIVKIITDCGSSERAAVEVTALLNEIESARYGKMENISNYKNTLFEKVTKLFQSLCVMLIAICTFYSVLAYPLKVSAKDSRNLQAGVIFLEAIKDYHNGNFQDAAKKFSSIVQAESDINDNIQTDNYYNKSVSSKKYQGIKNPYLYYNIGNAYIKAGDIGRAILWYERAKKEIPLDPDLRFNLEYAREFITDRLEISDDSSGIGISTGIDVSDLLFFWTDHFPPQMVNYSAIGLSFIFFTYAAIRTVRRRKIFTPAGVAIFTALIIAGSTSSYTYYSQRLSNFAVIISKEASVRSGSAKDATELFLLHSGTKVRVEEIKGDYLKIYFSKDKIGWVSVSDAEII